MELEPYLATWAGYHAIVQNDRLIGLFPTRRMAEEVIKFHGYPANTTTVRCIRTATLPAAQIL